MVEDPGEPGPAGPSGDLRRTAFVLAGGGTKGAFEAGALQYLVQVRSITPDVITAASAGAVAGLVLAQARTLEEFTRRTDDLRQDLLAMTRTDLLFGTQPWVSALDGTPFRGAIDRLLTEQTRPPIPGETMGPMVGGVPTRVGGQHRALELTVGVLRAMRTLPRARHQLRRGIGSVMNLDPLAEALRHGGTSGIRAVDPALVARPGLQLRMAVTALGAGALRYVTEAGTIVESDAVTPAAGSTAGPVDVIEGALSSSSVPMVFPPRRMAGESYVDGGVLQNIPVEPAVRLGARRIIAVLAVPLREPPDRRDFATVNLVGVFMRAVGAIAFSDRQRANLAYPLPEGCTLTVIDPTVDVVGPFEVSPGLMLIDMDYGWVRAADVLAELDTESRRLAVGATDALVTARTRAWYIEEAMWASGRADPGQLGALGHCKDAVRAAVATRQKLGLPAPPDVEQWWTRYESHAAPPPLGLPAAPPRS